MSQEQRNILKLDEEILKHASPIKHNWSINNTSIDYGKATNSLYGHVVVDTNLNESSNNPICNSTVTTAINQLISEKAVKNHASNTTDYGVATDSQYGHVIVDTELKNSTNPVRNSAVYSAINDINEDIETITSSLGTNTEGIKKLLNLNEPTEVTTEIDNLVEPGFYIYKNNEEKSLNYNTYYNDALIFVLRNETRIIQKIYPTKTISDNDNNVVYRLNGAEYCRFGIDDGVKIDWSILGLTYKPYTKTSDIVSSTKANDAQITVYENAAGFTIRWEQLNNKQQYEIVADELYAYETICDFNNLPIQGPFIFSSLIGKYDIRITSEKMEIRSTLNKGNIIKNIDVSFFVPRVTDIYNKFNI